MENLVHALYMAFAMMVFVVAFSLSIFLVGKLNTTTKTLVYNLDGSYYDSLSLSELIQNNDERNRSRIVGIDTIIPTLYRYYKESFAVKILDQDGNLIQYFDTTTEGDVNSAKITKDIDYTNPSYGYSSEEILNFEKQKSKRNALLSLYDSNVNRACYMFGAPWLANINKDAKARIDMYISGSKGYINNTLVDYSRECEGLNLGTVIEPKKIYLNNFKNRQFKEIFTQYAYEGDTISADDNGEIVSLTGNKQIATKIIIIYQLVP